MTASWILLVLAPFVVCSLVRGRSNELPYLVEYTENRTSCDEIEAIKWASVFHECFIDRKVKDGGQNLDTLVDRILQHAEACADSSVRSCRPQFLGFKKIMSRIISQIKDYSEMYLEEIFKGKENFKDVDCVEKILNLETYLKCFRILLLSPNVSQKSFERSATEGISCANRDNEGCSVEAKSSLNRMVGSILGISYKELPPPPTTQAPPPPPKRWYEYITQPFIAAWGAIRSFFGF